MNLKPQSFEDLWIWKESRQLVVEIYTDFGEGTPGARDYGFKDQAQRAGISIMNNIAEGFERNALAEYARHLDIAKGSCGEVRSMYYAAEDLGYVTPEVASQRRERAKRIARGISSLAHKLRDGSSEP
jgi:four helix bundle protein